MNLYNYSADGKSYIQVEEKNSSISNYQVEIINNNLDVSILPVKEMQINGGSKFQVDITGKESVSEVIKHKLLSYVEFINIVIKLCDLEVKCEEYLLNSKNLIINKNTIFVDKSSNEIYALYIPIKNTTMNRDMNQFKTFIDELIKYVDARIQKEEYEIIVSISKYLSSPNITFLRLRRYLESIQQRKKEDNLVIDKKEEVIVEPVEKKGLLVKLKGIFGSKKEVKVRNNPEIKVENNNQVVNKDIVEKEIKQEVNKSINGFFTMTIDNKLENIYIDKDIFLIGRMPDAVDYIINSNAIGRVHARIEKIEDDYYITDLNSKNGSYINGSRLIGNEKYKLSNGNEIKLANITICFNR